ncbi:MAG: ATP-binding cassette domain-containing protein [Planctomycetia bacterium]|nr:ATP-binding cassette domain-containing protein [Planctomycetia bacterium]
MVSAAAVVVSGLVYRYGQRLALDDVSLSIDQGEVFAFLGPNGGGKTTLFRLLSTLIPVQSGEIEILSLDAARQAHQVRRRIGVVFQAPSLDRKLTVAENLWQHARLYGLSGKVFQERRREMLLRFGLADRAGDLVETLSGGLRRRVELAKGLLHRPQLLLLDEPSTGLDPGARADLWEYLHRVRAEDGVTVVLTTHLLEEADKADRLAIMNAGRVVALDTPERLRSMVGGDTISIETPEPAALAASIRERFGREVTVVDGRVRFEQPDGPQWVARLATEFAGRIQSITVGKPTLEDVFIAKTGHRFREAEEVGVGE